MGTGTYPALPRSRSKHLSPLVESDLKDMSRFVVIGPECMVMRSGCMDELFSLVCFEGRMPNCSPVTKVYHSAPTWSSELLLLSRVLSAAAYDI